MANPNIVQVSQIYGESVGFGIGTSNGIMIPAVATGKVYKINSITISNIHTTNTSWISMFRQCAGINGPDGGGTLNGWIVYQIDIPPKASLAVIGKSTSLYLNEGHGITAVAQMASTLEFHASWEVIS